MRKALLLLFVFPFFINSLRAQGKIALGGILASSTYMGDFNSRGIFYTPNAYIGGVIKYAVSDYYNFSFNMAGGNLRGNPNSYSGNLVASTINQIPEKFNNFFFDVDARLDVGFMPYDPFATKKKYNFSPYYTIGIGAVYTNGIPVVKFPLGFGAKYRISYRITVGVEWIFSKTFSDNLDGWENLGENSLTNKDWLSYLGFYITYQISEKLFCPAFN
jgi:hypothetical protein